MGKALSYAVRKKITERRQKGETFCEIAQSLHCSESAVKKIWYAYKKEGEAAFDNKYDNCGRHSIYSESVKQQANAIRDNQQGAYYVHSKLLELVKLCAVPSTRTLNRWWVKAGTNRKAGRPTSVEKKVE